MLCCCLPDPALLSWGRSEQLRCVRAAPESPQEAAAVELLLSRMVLGARQQQGQSFPSRDVRPSP